MAAGISHASHLRGIAGAVEGSQQEAPDCGLDALLKRRWIRASMCEKHQGCGGDLASVALHDAAGAIEEAEQAAAGPPRRQQVEQSRDDVVSACAFPQSCCGLTVNTVVIVKVWLLRSAVPPAGHTVPR